MAFQLFAPLLGVILAASLVLSYQFQRRRLAALLTFYTSLFLVESVGGVTQALLPSSSPFVDVVPLEAAPGALTVLLGGYLLFLAGYVSLPRLFLPRSMPTANAIETFFETRWTSRYRKLLFAAILVTLAAGFVQHFQRVRAAGGLEAFLETAYQIRFGSLGETDEQNALIVIANIVGPAAVGLFGIVLLAAQRERLTRSERVIYGVLFAALLIRQWSSMFRSVLWFTLVSLIGVYDLARPLNRRRVVAVGLFLLTALSAINFGHQYLFHLTAAWDYQTFGQSLGHLLAPQNQLHTLSRVLETWEQGAEPLAGRGFLEGVAFFIPRWFWHDKAPYFESGTLLVQSWANLPTAYQLTITNVGELIAHFGLPGMLGMLAYGWLYRWLDTKGATSLEWRVAHACALLPRVPADSGAGLSAVALTLFGLAVFLSIAGALARLGAGVSRGSAPARARLEAPVESNHAQRSVTRSSFV